MITVSTAGWSMLVVASWVLATASWVEIAYFLTVGVGFGCNAWCWWDAREDRQSLQLFQGYRAEYDDAIAIADGYVREEIVRLAVQGLFLLLSVISLFTPARVQAQNPQRALVTLAFFAVTIALMVNSLINLRTRRRLNRPRIYP